jgi:hypothetical protein
LRILKIPYTKRAGGVAQVVQLLPSKWEALSSNPSTKTKNSSSEHHTYHTHSPSSRLNYRVPFRLFPLRIIKRTRVAGERGFWLLWPLLQPIRLTELDESPFWIRVLILINLLKLF